MRIPSKFQLQLRVAAPVGTWMLAALLCATLSAAPQGAWAKIKIAASVPDLGSIAASVGGDQVDVVSIARGNADAHRVEVLPSYMVRVSKAQLYLKVGLQLDQWADQIIDGSRNDKLMVVDCSQHIEALQKPTTRVDARQGDVHPNGNPHYWLDPRNGGIVARDVADALARLDPNHADLYHANAEKLAAEGDELAKAGAAKTANLPVKTILTYHSSWIYFATAFGLDIAGHVEPVPGIPPTGNHLQDLVELIKQRQIKVLVQEPYFSDEAGKFLAREAGIDPITAAPSCEDTKPGSYLAHISNVLDSIVSASTGA